MWKHFKYNIMYKGYQRTINNSACGKVTLRNCIHKKRPDILQKTCDEYRRLHLDKTNKLM